MCAAMSARTMRHGHTKQLVTHVWSRWWQRWGHLSVLEATQNVRRHLPYATHGGQRNGQVLHRSIR